MLKQPLIYSLIVLFAVSVWRWLGVKLNCSFSLLSFSSLLACIPHRCSSQVLDVFAAAMVHTVHTIWLARNTIRFSSSTINLHNTLEKISTLVTMSGLHSTGNCVVDDVACNIPLDDYWNITSQACQRTNAPGKQVRRRMFIK